MTGVQARLLELDLLEKRVSDLRWDKKRFCDPDMKLLLKGIQNVTQQIVLADCTIAQERQVETSMWILCFYGPVQEFRTRLAACARKRDRASESAGHWGKAFLELLTDGIAFYLVLIKKVQLVYGDVGVTLTAREMSALSGTNFESFRAESKRLGDEQPDIRPSICCYLICLGDLTRYKIELDPTINQDWSKATKYYDRAIAINPEGGLAFHQKAHLALKGDPPLRVPAVYMFCRSLAVENVPSIAKGNLTQVFQDVCRSYKKLDSPNRDGNRTKSREFGRPLPELMRLVELQLLYINGLLFLGSSLENLQNAVHATLPDLEELLGRDAVVGGPAGYGPQGSETAIFQLCAIAVFHPKHDDAAVRCVEAEVAEDANVEENETSNAPLRRASHMFVFILLARIASRVVKGTVNKPWGPASSPIAHALLLLLQWLSTHPSALHEGSSEDCTPRPVFQALKDLMIAVASTCERNGLAISDIIRVTTPQRPLPEDVELRGYGPLKAAQTSVDFSKPAVEETLLDKQRLKRTVKQLDRLGRLLFSIGDQSSLDTASSDFVAQWNESFGACQDKQQHSSRHTRKLNQLWQTRSLASLPSECGVG